MTPRTRPPAPGKSSGKRSATPSAPDEIEPLPPAAGIAAFLILLLFGALALLALRNLFVIVFVGTICHKGSGCASWSARPWDMGWETVGTVMSLFFSVMICLGCIQAIGRVSDGD
ncbi:hypothetical protein LE190_01860 [Massilia oculi]|uniref:Uncharacterized protein n=1 Tax=Massilia hydrophila TaxID=3044279 RepID=A0ABS7Y803_9BURK|nr:hypothetical protein [Massilia oculi]MCA1854674.1 hypothetical protein [Massilia oculi]